MNKHTAQLKEYAAKAGFRALHVRAPLTKTLRKKAMRIRGRIRITNYLMGLVRRPVR